MGQNFGAEVLRTLRAISGFEVKTKPTGMVFGPGVDAIVQYAGTETAVAVEIKSRVNSATAHLLAHIAQANPDLPLLLVAGETTKEARRILTEHNIAFIDGLGNAQLELPGLLFRVTGAVQPQTSRIPARLSGKAGLIAQALLLEHGRDWQIKDLAQKTGTSAGLVHRVLARMAAAGIVSTSGTGSRRTRRVVNPTALLDLWAEENDDKLIRTYAYQLAQTPQQLLGDLGGALDAAAIEYAFTGAAVAAVIAPFVTNIVVTEVWISAIVPVTDLFDNTPAKPVTDGHNVVFLQSRDNLPLAFRRKVNGYWIANQLRLYVDLRRDPRRGVAQADYLRQEIIGF